MSAGVFQFNTVMVTSPKTVRPSVGAFLQLIQDEMAAIRRDAKDAIARELYGGGADRWELAVQQAVSAL